MGNTSLLLKVYILDNKFIVEKKLQLLSEMFYQSIKCQKVPLYLMLKLNGVTEVVSLELQELIVLLLDTLKMETKLESDYHLDLEKLSLDIAEPPLVSLLEVEELINQSLKLVISSINIKEKEKCGQLLEVLL